MPVGAKVQTFADDGFQRLYETAAELLQRSVTETANDLYVQAVRIGPHVLTANEPATRARA